MAERVFATLLRPRIDEARTAGTAVFAGLTGAKGGKFFPTRQDLPGMSKANPLESIDSVPVAPALQVDPERS